MTSERGQRRESHRQTLQNELDRTLAAGHDNGTENQRMYVESLRRLLSLPPYLFRIHPRNRRKIGVQ